MGLESTQVHYYCGHLQAYCASPGWQMIIVDQLLEWMSRRENRSSRTVPVSFCPRQTKKKKNSVAFSPQANYTDWATATCWWNLVPTFVDRGVSCGRRGGSPTVVNLSFLNRSRYFSFK
jgi:hypothetical protein